MIGFVGGLAAPPVLSVYPDYMDYYFETPGEYSFAVPKGAKTLDLTVIGGGAGGQEGGVSYGNIANAYPGGGGAGASGEMAHMMHVSTQPGAIYSVKVGKAGTAFGGAGGTSQFGDVISAAGGQSGARGDNEPLDNTSTANGGSGGIGGIGGNGGGAGRGQFSGLLGNAGPDGGSTLNWPDWAIDDWYVFRDVSTGRRLGQGGRGGDGYETGGFSSRAARGLTTEQAPGVCYGGGGRGGDQRKSGPVKTPTAGQNGLVAIRVWFKKR